MKKQIFISLIAFALMSSSAHSQKDLFFADIKLAKDTLYPFDVLELTVYLKALEPAIAYPYDKSALLQIRMEEPQQSKWYSYRGIEGNFGGFIDDDSRSKRLLTPDYTFSMPFFFENSPNLELVWKESIHPYSLHPGKYSLRLIYSPNKLLEDFWWVDTAIEKCEDCVIKIVPLIASDRYPEKDQAAYEWIKKLKYPHCFYLENYLVYTNEEYIEMGEEFLRLFPESCFLPFVHCKIGDSLRRIYEQDANSDKALPEETVKKMQTIIMHLSYYKQIKGQDELYIYYKEMHKKFQDRLLSFQVRHGIK
jgi:hypothetical protein